MESRNKRKANRTRKVCILEKCSLYVHRTSTMMFRLYALERTYVKIYAFCCSSLKDCPHWRLQSPISATFVAENGDCRRQSPFSATVAVFGDSVEWTGLCTNEHVRDRFHYFSRILLALVHTDCVIVTFTYILRFQLVYHTFIHFHTQTIWFSMIRMSFGRRQGCVGRYQ